MILRFYLGALPLKVLKVLKPTVSRESFWNHSIKKLSDITTPFILNDDIICIIAFLDVFCTEKSCQNKHKIVWNPGPPPLIKEIFLNFTNYLVASH